MAYLPPIRRFYIEDFKDQKSWIAPLLINLNNFMTSIVTSLNANLTIINNTTSDIKEITLDAVPSTAAPASVAWTKPNARPIAVVVGNVSLINQVLTLSNAIQIQWQMSGDGASLQLTNIIGITPSATNKYTLTLVCISG